MQPVTDYGVDYPNAQYVPTEDLRELIRLDFQRRFRCNPGLAWWIPQNDRPKRVMDLGAVTLDTGTLQGLRSQITSVASSCPFVDSAFVDALYQRGDTLYCSLLLDPLQGARLRVTLATDGETLTVTIEATT